MEAIEWDFGAAFTIALLILILSAPDDTSYCHCPKGNNNYLAARLPGSRIKFSESDAQYYRVILERVSYTVGKKNAI
ncbi:hypothetical protein IFR05_009371 [Cadophora sp. M221]|nr:hypothetical protein IFR05_009371 [Cadophora sp. M221]